MDLVNKLLKGDKRACARIITKIENDEVEASNIIKELYKYTGNAHIIGITGPPGGGKSTLTDKLTKLLLKDNKKIGIIAIDPTSPFTGGSILGDRIRMQDLATNPNVFIRSMGARGHLGGLSKSTSLSAKVLDAFGCDYIFIETVGVGQSEIDIVKTADTVVMVMVPGLGDDIQAIKAGIMEIGDIFAINKSDLDGADKTKVEIRMMLELNQNMEVLAPIVKVIARDNKNIDELLSEIKNHMNYMKDNDILEKRREENSKLEILKLVEEKIINMILNKNSNNDYLSIISKKVANRDIDPFSARDEVINLIKE